MHGETQPYIFHILMWDKKHTILEKFRKLQRYSWIKKNVAATWSEKNAIKRSIYHYIVSCDYLKENMVLFRGFNRISILYGKKNTTAHVILHFVARFVYVEV